LHIVYSPPNNKYNTNNNGDRMREGGEMPEIESNSVERV